MSFAPRGITALAIVASALPTLATAQRRIEDHRASAGQLIDAVLRDSVAYRRLAILTDRFGHRMSGSESLRRSVGTPPNGIRAPVLVVRSFAELGARPADARGKIVLFNAPFDTVADTTRTKASLMAADTALVRATARKGPSALLDAAAPHAAILIPGHPILRADAARDALVRRYGSPASYEWQPAHAVASIDGGFGCTMGFSARRPPPNDSAGRTRGVYTTCWERTSSGGWRIVGHQRNEPANAADTGAAWTLTAPPHSATVSFRGDAKTETQHADAEFAALADGASGPGPAFARFIAADGILLAPPNFPAGPRGVELAFEGFPATQVLEWEPMRAFGGGGGGLAYTVGHSVRRARDGSTAGESRSKYFTVWRQRDDGRWEYILDFGSPRP